MQWVMAILLMLGAADVSALVGEWSGESKCVSNRPACVDEQNVYVLGPASSTGTVHVVAYKVVNGERVEMGQSDYRYDDQTHRLTWEFAVGTTHGLWEFTVSDAVLQGTLTLLPDRTIVRRVTLHKSSSV
jgi:hypothetical protein